LLNAKIANLDPSNVTTLGQPAGLLFPPTLRKGNV